MFPPRNAIHSDSLATMPTTSCRQKNENPNSHDPIHTPRPRYFLLKLTNRKQETYRAVEDVDSMDGRGGSRGGFGRVERPGEEAARDSEEARRGRGRGSRNHHDLGVFLPFGIWVRGSAGSGESYYRVGRFRGKLLSGPPLDRKPDRRRFRP